MSPDCVPSRAAIGVDILVVLAVTATHGYSADQATLHLEPTTRLFSEQARCFHLFHPSALATSGDALWLARTSWLALRRRDLIVAHQRAGQSAPRPHCGW